MIRVICPQCWRTPAVEMPPGCRALHRLYASHRRCHLQIVAGDCGNRIYEWKEKGNKEMILIDKFCRGPKMRKEA